jgi:hypothetical protein
LFEYGAGRQGTAVMQNRTVGAPWTLSCW